MSAGRNLAQAMMRAIRVSKFGGPEVLKLETDVPIPKPLEKEILIRVAAAGVNPVDTYIRAGTYAVKSSLPYTPGSDGSGVIEAVGSEIKKFKKGDRVYAIRTKTGSYAEYASAEEMYIGHLGDRLTLEQGAGIGIPYYTAYRALNYRAHARPGETVLIHGASGAVGTASVQIAKSMGLRVFGTAGSPEGLELVKRCGADEVFNHREEGYTQKIMTASDGLGVEVILEMLSNVNLDKDLEMIRFHGRIVNIGSRGTIEINPRFTMVKECTITGVMLMATAEEEWKEMHAAIQAGIHTGWLMPQIGKQYPLEKASDTHIDIINTKAAQGSIILKM